MIVNRKKIDELLEGEITLEDCEMIFYAIDGQMEKILRNKTMDYLDYCITTYRRMCQKGHHDSYVKLALFYANTDIDSRIEIAVRLLNMVLNENPNHIYALMMFARFIEKNKLYKIYPNRQERNNMYKEFLTRASNEYMTNINTINKNIHIFYGKKACYDMMLYSFHNLNGFSYRALFEFSFQKALMYYEYADNFGVWYPLMRTLKEEIDQLEKLKDNCTKEQAEEIFKIGLKYIFENPFKTIPTNFFEFAVKHNVKYAQEALDDANNINKKIYSITI